MVLDFAWKELPNELFGQLLELGMKRRDDKQVLTGFIFMLVEKGRDFLDHDFDEETWRGLDDDDEHLLEVFYDAEFTFLFNYEDTTIDLLSPGQFSDNELCYNKRKDLAA
jgi:hypothetical protein